MKRSGAAALRRACSVVLSLCLAAGPALQAPSAFAEHPPPQKPAATSSAPVTVVREVEERRTDNATHWLLSDGTYRADITEAPTRFLDDSGEWTDIDTSRVPAEEPGATESAATSLTVEMDGQDPGEAPVTVSGDDFSAGIDMLGVAEAARLTFDDATRYLNVAQDTDLEYQVTDTGVKETVILKSADAPTTFNFELDLDGLEIRTDPLNGYVSRPSSSPQTSRAGSLFATRCMRGTRRRASTTARSDTMIRGRLPSSARTPRGPMARRARTSTAQGTRWGVRIRRGCGRRAGCPEDSTTVTNSRRCITQP